MTIAFPKPNPKMYNLNTMTLGKVVALGMFKRANGRPAKDNAECFEWFKKTALENGWTNVKETPTRLQLTVHFGVQRTVK